MAEHTHDERVRLRAYEIWLSEGKPEGREQRHWEMARELVGHEDAQRSRLLPANGGTDEPVAPAPVRGARAAPRAGTAAKGAGPTPAMARATIKSEPPVSRGGRRKPTS